MTDEFRKRIYGYVVKKKKIKQESMHLPSVHVIALCKRKAYLFMENPILFDIYLHKLTYYYIVRFTLFLNKINTKNVLSFPLILKAYT